MNLVVVIILPKPIAGVYHCTDPVPVEPDWGIAVRVSQEAEGVVGADATATATTAERVMEEERLGVSGSGAATGLGASEVSTPPLLVPLQSGDAYFLLDDFK